MADRWIHPGPPRKPCSDRTRRGGTRQRPIHFGSGAGRGAFGFRQLADLLRSLRRLALQHVVPDYPGQCAPVAPALDVPGARRAGNPLRVQRDRAGRRPLHHHTTERSPGARCGDRSASLVVRAGAARPTLPLLRPVQPGTRDPGEHPLPRDPRCPPRRSRREERQHTMGHRGRRPRHGVFVHVGPACGQGFGGDRERRRGVRHPRIYRRV
jgi:hypothetical protein